MFKSYGAILFGVTIGFISLIPLQALTNSQARNKCFDTSDTHTLVSVRAFAGVADYCVDNRYLWLYSSLAGGLFLCVTCIY